VKKHLSVPKPVAIHAVGILGEAQKKCAKTLCTADKVAVRTLLALNTFTTN
jgi:hypothetical protein